MGINGRNRDTTDDTSKTGNVHVIYAVVVSVIVLLVIIFLLLFIFHRRRQRAFLLMTLAQEEANRRRRKRKKAGLRRWEIDSVCPEALVTSVTNDVSSATLLSQHDHPLHYHKGLATLRAARLLPTIALPSSTLLPVKSTHRVLSPPPPPLVATRLPLSDCSRTLAESVNPSPKTEAVPSLEALPEEHVKPIDRIPSHIAILPQTVDMCVICLEHLQLAQKVRILPCSHLYHSQCIRLWLRRKNSCPCCTEKVIKRRTRKHEFVRPQTQTLHASPSPNVSVPIEDELHSHRSPCTARPVTPLGGGAPPRPVDDPVTLLRVESTGTELTASPSITPSSSMWPERMSSLQARRSVKAQPQQPVLSFPRSPSSNDGRDDVSSDLCMHSEASSHVGEEPSTAEVLFHVRTALRTDSALSINASTAGWSDAPVTEDQELVGQVHDNNVADYDIAFAPDEWQHPRSRR